jgi:hypothetical protein
LNRSGRIDDDPQTARGCSGSAAHNPARREVLDAQRALPRSRALRVRRRLRPRTNTTALQGNNVALLALQIAYSITSVTMFACRNSSTVGNHTWSAGVASMCWMKSSGTFAARSTPVMCAPTMVSA